MSAMPEGLFTGGCQCGAVRFRAERLRANPHVCYCRMCQKATGNLFASLVGVKHADLSWTRGTPAEFLSSDYGRARLLQRLRNVALLSHPGRPARLALDRRL